jgi:hypothetical protein
LDFNFTCGACFVDFDADVGCGSIIPTEDGLYLCRKNPTIREKIAFMFLLLTEVV